ncbi:density-regulated protein [Sphaerodactylus townsendi]|uniref:density-regulated protein n=1 Tax=Sphaerodactylus townsendi TaxID=933632 RepID=UPI002027207C|nr:density-regulated protein [Sphaerodactylus townsendi]
MATDTMEPVVLNCKGDQRCNTRADANYPLRVLYCGVCSLPTEYCEYMPDVAKCRQWLEKNFPKEFAKLTVENCPKRESGTGEGQGTAGEEEEKKKQKRGGRGQIKQKKKTVPQKVTIAKIPRAKKKYVTRVCGLATFVTLPQGWRLLKSLHEGWEKWEDSFPPLLPPKSLHETFQILASSMCSEVKGRYWVVL